MLMETLERRLHLSRAISLSGGTLMIRGDDTAESITISRQGRFVVGAIVEAASGKVAVMKRINASAVRRLHIDAGGGNDVVSVAQGLNGHRRSLVPATILGGSGNDMLNGGSGADHLDGGLGDDVLYGNAGNDKLTDLSGNDRFFGGDGDDEIVSNGQGVAFADPGADLYTNVGHLTYEESTSGVHVDLTAGLGRGGLAEGDRYLGRIHKLWGSAFSDTLIGSDFNDSIHGLGGLDRLEGRGGDDWLDAGSKGESVFGGSGFDISAWDWVIDGARPSDVYQTSTGTCVLLSVLAGLARTSGHIFKDNITYLGNFLYQVYLFDGSQWSPVKVHFDGTRLANERDPRMPDQGNSLNEFWVTLYQRAYLQFQFGIAPGNDAGYKNFGGENDGRRAFRSVAGRSGHNFSASSISPGELSARLRNGWEAVVFAPARNTVPELNIQPKDKQGNGHAYTVLDVQQSGGAWWVLVRNPWGVDGGARTSGDPNDGLIWLSWSDFRRGFSRGGTLA